MINVFQPTLGDEEVAAVREVFASGWLGRGRRTETFEAAFADHLGVPADEVRSVNSCTEALFVAMEVLGVGPGDEVVLPSVSFVGAANAIAARGATPVFCDVDPTTLNPTVGHVDAALTARTVGVLVLHYGGYPGDIVAISRLCRERGLFLVEDAACAVASSVAGRACGTFGDIGVWSFDAMKTLVTGDGGMMWLRDPALARQVGTTTYLGMRQTAGFTQAGGDATRWWEFEVDSFSRRSITNDICAAIGLVQLRRLPAFISRRRAVAEEYDAQFANLGFLRRPPALPAGHRTSYTFYWIGLPAGARDEVARRLYDAGIYTTFRYLPLHTVAAYGYRGPRLAGAEQAARETLCLPLHQGLDDHAVRKVIDNVRAAMRAISAPRPA
ncbi:DegT/DnrJ/EryC1/StrS family aminotransferase [Micromonospora craterilacus]|uniref:DegT/DnrJ/EryC1/StrS family aminotransferase n=1 Tax=Micromonospora craterilacus TaxID=1655439 RepID=A0A2W2ERE9_9ACTN|nr:DegT/DnrJ/EryC1/StrS family aminotransferase [Micromonospora craterilacus]PZG19359.1 DegT/DnrJ/EryC1/StrS family aminotransferase [Micromonospora craterilacus]